MNTTDDTDVTVDPSEDAHSKAAPVPDAGPAPVPTPGPAAGDPEQPPGRGGWPGRFLRATGQAFRRAWPKSTPGRVLMACVLAVGVLAGVSSLWAVTSAPESVSLTTVTSAITDGNVTEATLEGGSGTTGQVTITLEDGTAQQATYQAAYADTLTDLLLEHDVDVSTPTPPPTALVLIQLVLLQFGPLIVILMLLLWYLSKQSGGLSSGNQALREPANAPSTRFTDVAGAVEAVQDMRELVQFLTGGADRFTAVGAKPPAGALLVGPPGTGKTLLARAVAGEAGVPFFALNGPDFVQMFVGVGPHRMRKVFAAARKHEQGAVVFIDEIDAIAQARSDGPVSGGDREVENTLLALMTLLDGYTPQSNVVVLAATNRPDIIDPALTRPGRLDRQVQVPLPDRDGRAAILAVHASGKPFADEVDWKGVARQTPGMSGAELAQVVNEAAMVAGRQSATVITGDHVQSAIHTVAMGRARESAFVTERDRAITAWHEAGHTVAALVLDDADDPVSVTIVPRGVSGGATWMAGSDDQYMTRAQARARLTVAMGGRAGEEVLLDGDHTQGAHGDLTSATDLATNMVTRFGMTGAGLAIVPDVTLRAGGPVAVAAHAQIQDLLGEALDTARDVMVEHRALLVAVAEELLVRESLSLADLSRLRARVDGTVAPQDDPSPAGSVPREGDQGGVSEGTARDKVAAVTPGQDRARA